MTPSMAEEATVPSAGNNRACSNRRYRENKQGQGTEALRRDLYAMEVDQGRNYYACGRFGHIAHHCRNRGRGRPIEGRRVEYGRGIIEEIYDNANNLKEMENLELLN